MEWLSEVTRKGDSERGDESVKAGVDLASSRSSVWKHGPAEWYLETAGLCRLGPQTGQSHLFSEWLGD